MDSLLSISSLSKNYISDKSITSAVKDITFDVNKGEFIVLVGPSGCGKSTILSIIGGLEKKSCGKLKFKNDSIKLGYMFQEDALLPWLTVYENCTLGLRIKNKISDDDKKYVINLLKKYELDNFIDRYPGELSGGMRQRVSLIRTLATKPDILLLDEPFSALDYQTRITVCDDVFKIIKDLDKTAIMVTHDISEAISIADKIIVLSKRPSTIKNIYKIKKDSKKTPSLNRQNKDFDKYYNLIWSDMNES